MKAEIKYAAAVVEMTTTGRMLSFIILKTMSATVKIEITQKLYSGKESFPNTVQREAYVPAIAMNGFIALSFEKHAISSAAPNGYISAAMETLPIKNEVKSTKAR